MKFEAASGHRARSWDHRYVLDSFVPIWTCTFTSLQIKTHLVKLHSLLAPPSGHPTAMLSLVIKEASLKQDV
jgi:hypothetical protein